VSELKKWSEDGAPAQVRRLLEVGQWESPSRAVFEQTLRRLQAAGAGGALDIELPGARTNAVSSAVKWTLVGALMVGTIATLTHTVSWQKPVVVPDPGEQSETSPAPIEPDRRAAREVSSPEIVAPAPSARIEPVAPSSAKTAHKSPSERSTGVAPKTAAATSVCKPAVVEQIQMLEQVKSSIRAGRAGEALALLDRYDAYGKGRCFVPESMKHRMDAQLELGDRAAARRTAAAIKKRYPDTAQARAAEGILGR